MRQAFVALVVGAALGVVAACGGAAAPATPPGNACDRQLITKADLSGVLKDPITSMKSLASDGDPQTCEFVTDVFSSVTVTLRPGLGDVTVGTWASGRMPSAAEALAGIGDRAVWVPGLQEVVATRHNLLCDVAVSGPPHTAAPADVVKRRLGEACQKILAAQ